MAYLEELRETAKVFGVDTGNKHMDAIQLYREIAKTLGVDLGTEHKGVVELLALINKALPDALGGGDVILPYNQTNPNLYYGQFIANNTVIEIDLIKLAAWIETSDYASEWAAWPSSNINNPTIPLLVTNVKSTDGEDLDNLQLSLEYTGKIRIYGVNASGKYSLMAFCDGNCSGTPLSELINCGTTVAVLDKSVTNFFGYIPNAYVESAPGLSKSNSTITNTNDFIKIYNV